MVDWIDRNGLRMNVSKTNLLVLSPKRRSPDSVSVTIKGEEIMQQDQVKYLGVIVDKDLIGRFTLRRRVTSALLGFPTGKHEIPTNRIQEIDV